MIDGPMVATLTGVLVPVILIQVGVRFGLGRRLPIGDEVEYLERVGRADPFGPEPFLRVPLTTALLRLAGRTRTEPRARNALAGLAVVSMALTSGAAFLTYGITGAFTCGLLLAFLPDRIIMSQHLWPDSLLAVWHSALLLALTVSRTGTPVSPWLLGALVAIAVMTRIDNVVLLPALSFHLVISDSGPMALLALWVPATIALAAVTARNRARYGIPWPDTTPFFNVTVAGHEARWPAGKPYVNELVGETWAQWAATAHRERVPISRRAAVQIVGAPLRTLLGIAGRALQMLGRDSFAFHLLLDERRGAYPDLSHPMRTVLRHSLRVGFPLLVGLSAAGIAVGRGHDQWFLLPLGAVFLAACAFHARTRYRYPILPYLAYAATEGILTLIDPRTRVAAAVLTLIIGGALALTPQRPECRCPGAP